MTPRRQLNVWSTVLVVASAFAAGCTGQGAPPSGQVNDVGDRATGQGSTDAEASSRSDEATEIAEIATLQGDTFFNDAGVECCVPSAATGCCMKFGGAKQTRGHCSKVCDGMPVSGFHLVHDFFGCPTWSSKGSNSPCCGGRVQDAAMPVYQCWPDPIPVP